MDERCVPVGSPEGIEAGAVVGELRAVLGAVQLRGWQLRQLAGFGDLVRREDGACVGVSMRDAATQVALAGSVIAERWVV